MKTSTTSRGFIFIALLIALGILVIGTGTYYEIQKTHLVIPSEMATTTPSTAVAPAATVTASSTNETPNQQTYQNADIGIQFNYPADKVLQAATDIGYFSGKEIVIKETGPSLLALTAVTTDYSTDSPSGTFHGKDTNDALLSCASYVLTPCKEFQIQGHKGIMAYEIVGRDGGGHFLEKVVRIKNQDGLYSGLEVDVVFPSLDCPAIQASPICPGGGNSGSYGKYQENLQTKINTSDFSPEEKQASQMLDILVSSLKFTSPTTTSVDSIVGWKTYSNATLGVEFKYPVDISVSASSSLVSVGFPKHSFFSFDVLANPSELSFAEWFKSYFPAAQNTDCKFMKSNLSIGTYEAYLVDVGSLDENCNNAGYYALSADKKIIAKFSFGQDPDPRVVDMLPTFKFTSK